MRKKSKNGKFFVTQRDLIKWMEKIGFKFKKVRPVQYKIVKEPKFK